MHLPCSQFSTTALVSLDVADPGPHHLNGEHTEPSWHHIQSKRFTFMNINILLFKYLKTSIHRWKWMRTDLDLIHQLNVAQ